MTEEKIRQVLTKYSLVPIPTRLRKIEKNWYRIYFHKSDTLLFSRIEEELRKLRFEVHPDVSADMSQIDVYNHFQEDNPMTERIKEGRISENGLGVGGAPRKGVPKTEEERKEEHIRRYGTEELPPRGTGLEKNKLVNEKIIMMDLERGETVPGGIVVNEEKALATPCHGYDLGEGKKILWSEGVIGGLSLPEQEKYCKKGMDLKPMSGALEKRIKALREAGIRFK